MTARPILFSGPMIRAILAGTKTVTRRVVKPQPSSQADLITPLFDPAIGWRFYGGPNLRCPYGEPADQLWVRETFQPLFADGFEEDEVDWQTGDGYAPRYLATDDRAEYNHCEHGITNRAMPSIHMPRWASRITLRVTSVRVERLHEISEADAIAEGVDLELVHRMGGAVAFSELWESINGERAPWASNPFVWVVSFTRAAP